MKRKADSLSDSAIWQRIRRNGSFRVKKTELANGSGVQNVRAGITDLQPDVLEHEEEIPPAFSLNFVDGIVGDSENVEIEDNSSNGDPADTDEDFQYQSEPDLCDLRDDLHSWAVGYQIRHTAMDALLKILKTHIPNNALPKDSRTLLKTPAKVVITSNPELDGQYWHHGLQCGLINVLTKANLFPDKVTINVNIDGLPISKSSTTNFWPILVNIFELEKIPPFVVGIFSGPSE